MTAVEVAVRGAGAAAAALAAVDAAVEVAPVAAVAAEATGAVQAVAGAEGVGAARVRGVVGAAATSALLQMDPTTDSGTTQSNSRAHQWGPWPRPHCCRQTGPLAMT